MVPLAIWRAVGVALLQFALVVVLMLYTFLSSDGVAALLMGTTVLAALCLPNTMLLVAAHVQSWQRPALQICVVRVVLMVPVYAIDSWLGIMHAIIGGGYRWACSASGEWRSCGLADGVRELYGAFVIYSFVTYLLRAFGTEAELAMLLSNKAQVEHFWPLNHLLPQWRMGPAFLVRCKRGALQYVVVRLVVTVLDVSLNLSAAAADSAPGESLGMLSMLLSNGSQMWAMYSLVLFYYAMRKELAPLRPLAKFLCIKFVVFLTFWQTLAIESVSRIGWLDGPYASVSRGQLTSIIKDGLLVVEMWFASLIHPFAFPPSDYSGRRSGGLFEETDAPGGGAGGPTERQNSLPSMGHALHEALLAPVLSPFGELEQAGGIPRVLSPHALGLLRGGRESNVQVDRFSEVKPEVMREPPNSVGRSGRCSTPSGASGVASSNG